MSSNSWIEDFRAYRRERLNVRVALGLPTLLTLASISLNRTTDVYQILLRWIVALLIVVQFRLWDDLSDLQRDRIDFPDRVLCRTDNLWSFRAGVALLAVLNLLLANVALSPVGLAVLVGLNLGFAVWYRWVKHRIRNAILNYHVVLLKYPILIIALGTLKTTDDVFPRLSVLVLFYLCLCLFEALDDDRIVGAEPVLALELGAYVILCFVVSRRLQQAGAPEWMLASLTTAAGMWSLIAFENHKRRMQSTRKYGIVAITVIWLAFYAMANRG